MIANNNIKVLLLTAVCVLLAVASAMAAEPGAEEAAANASESEETANASQETEVSEDNYRRFMELKDRPGERNKLSASAYVKPLFLEKMQNLPAASQKHLRNELRDIIVQGGQWSPENLALDYAYKPSEAAQTDRALQSQESEAWDELLSEYHAREADIYAHSARSQAAAKNTASGSGARGENSAVSAGADGAANTGNGQNISATEALETGAFSASANDTADSVSSRGVSQNALEFLTGGKNGGPAPRPPVAVAQTGPGDATSPEGQTQEQASTDMVIVSPGVLSIEDLSNAQGVIVPSPAADSADEEDADQDETPNEGDGGS